MQARQQQSAPEGADNGDLFRVRATADGGAAPDQATAADDDADGLDASWLPPAEPDLARWRQADAAEALRDRFVTGAAHILFLLAALVLAHAVSKH